MYARYAECYHEREASPNFGLLKYFRGYRAAKTTEIIAAHKAVRQMGRGGGQRWSINVYTPKHTAKNTGYITRH
jgi:hypothetical protein